MATQIHGAGPSGERSPGLNAAIAAYLDENPPAGGGGAGVELVDGTVTLDDTGSPVREFYCTDAATINGVAFDADTAVVFRRTSADVWGYIIVEPWTDISATTTTTTTEATTTTTTTEATTTTTTTTSGPSIVQSKSAAGSTVTLDAAPTPGNLLVVGATNGITSPSVDWTYSHTLTIDEEFDEGGWDAVILSGEVEVGDSATVTITGMNASYDPAITVWELSGVTGPAASTDGAGGGSGTATTITGLGVTSGDIVLAVVKWSGNTTASTAAATGMTKTYDDRKNAAFQAVSPTQPFSTDITWATGRTASAVMGGYS